MTKKQKQKTTTTVNPCITCKYKSMKIYCSLMKLLSSVHQEEKQSGARLFVSGENQIRDQWANNHDIKDVNKGFDVFQPINKSGQSAYDVLSQRSTEEGRSGGVSDEKTWHTSHHMMDRSRLWSTCLCFAGTQARRWQHLHGKSFFITGRKFISSWSA